MADLVGRTINASGTDGGTNGPRRAMQRSGSYNTRAGASTIATDDIGHDVTRLCECFNTLLYVIVADELRYCVNKRS